LVIEKLEFLQKGLNFENVVEGKKISPIWYQTQIAALGYARFVENSLNILISELEVTFLKEIKTLVAENKYLFAAQLVQRGLEGCNKFNYHLLEIKAFYNRLSPLRLVHDIPWPEIDWDSMTSRIDNIHENLIITCGETADSLINIPRSKYWPDYFGHSYYILSNECYNAMSNDNEKLFNIIYPKLFAVCLAASERIRDHFKDQEAQTAMIYYTEPIMDLLALSGYALVYSELYQKGFWKVTKIVWDTYFESTGKGEDIIKFITTIVALRGSIYSILPGDLGRTSWQQDFSHKLREMGLLRELSFHPPFENKTKSFHLSPIIRALTRGRTMFFDKIEDVFLGFYIKSRPEALNIGLPHGAESFAKSIIQEQGNDKPLEGEPDD